MAATKNYVDLRTPFLVSSILLTPFSTSTATTNITNFDGFTTSATKETSTGNVGLTIASMRITVNYNNMGYIPKF
jgi:hypothetical protein